ncbi:MAG: hypothetical protein RRZ84_07345 [Romboutsia sp.]
MNKVSIISKKKVRVIITSWILSLLLFLVSAYFNSNYFICYLTFLVAVILMGISSIIHYKYIRCDSCDYLIPFRLLTWNNNPKFCHHCGTELIYK